MIKPRLQGTDNSGRPYNVSGDYATQQSQNVIEITKMQADLTLSDGSWVSLMSEAGVIELDVMKILLKGEAGIFHDNGYEFHSHDVIVDVKTKNVFSDNPVRGQGLPGTLFADRFTLDAESGMIKFDGNVKVTISAN